MLFFVVYRFFSSYLGWRRRRSVRKLERFGRRRGRVEDPEVQRPGEKEGLDWTGWWVPDK
jgi:hypothetical protein